MSTATAGRAREYKVRDHMAEWDWVPIMRAAASKGAADLLMAHPYHGAALVQVGTIHKSLGPSDRARFVGAAHLCHALPLLATVTQGRITYWLVTVDSPSKWDRFEVEPTS